MNRDVQVLCRRFGIPLERLERLETLVSQDTVFVATPEVMRFDAVRPMRRGIRLARLFSRSVKPTTWAMQVLGRHATRNVIDVSEDQAAMLVNGGQFEVESDAGDGYVLVRCRGYIVGVGLYHRPLLKTQIPRIREVEE